MTVDQHGYGSATYALAAGIPIKVVSEDLGHANTKITEDLYTFCPNSSKRQQRLWQPQSHARRGTDDQRAHHVHIKRDFAPNPRRGPTQRCRSERRLKDLTPGWALGPSPACVRSSIKSRSIMLDVFLRAPVRGISFPRAARSSVPALAEGGRTGAAPRGRPSRSLSICATRTERQGGADVLERPSGAGWRLGWRAWAPAAEVCRSAACADIPRPR